MASPDSIPFVYDTLPPNHFRLVTFSRNQEDHVIAKLRTVPLVPTPQYKALSYSWGDSDPEAMLQYPSITCTSAAGAASGSVKTSPNLLAAIECIHDDGGEILPVWIDSLCINQEDKRGEKPQQIALMHQIFGKAQQVIAWLGPESVSGGSNIAMELTILYGSNAAYSPATFSQTVSQLPHLRDRVASNKPYTLTVDNVMSLIRLLEATTQVSTGVAMNEAYFEYLGLPHYLDSIWKDLVDLFNRDILTRVWCFGELLLCKNTVARCGRHRVPWKTYKEMGMALARSQLLFHNVYAYGIKENSADEKINLLRSFEYTDTSYFWLHVRNGRDKKCSKKIDRIRGHTSLATEKVRQRIMAHPSFGDEGQYLALYKHTAKILMEEWQMHLTLSGVDSLHKSSLPSWCPDYDKPPLNPASVPFGKAGFFIPDSNQVLVADDASDDIIHVGGFDVDTIEEILPCDWRWEREQAKIKDNVGPHGHAAINVAWLRRARDLIARARPPSAMEAYWQTILAYVPPEADGRPMTAHNFPANGSRGLELLETRFAELASDVSRAESSLTPSQFEEMQPTMSYLGKLWRTNMCIFRTVKGRTGFSSLRARNGDKVCIFVGNTHLYLLRPTELAKIYEFISVAYVRGLMMGEGLACVQEGSHEMFTIR